MRRTKIYIPAQRIDADQYFRRKWYHKIASALGYIAAGFAFYALILFLAWNLLSGCGQAQYYADGTWRTGECEPAWLFPTYEVKTGTW